MADKKKFKFPSLYELREKRLKNAIKLQELNRKYYELDQETQGYKKLSKQGNFSKQTIIFCLGFIAVFAVLCLFAEYKAALVNIKLDTYMLLRVTAAVFGGELLFLLLKRLWTSDDNKIKRFIKKNNKNTEEASEQNSDIPIDIDNTEIAKSNDELITNETLKKVSDPEISAMVNEVNSSIGRS